MEQIRGLEKHWEARNKKRPAFLPLREVRDKSGNIIAGAKSQQLRQRVAAETDPIRAAFLLGQISKQVSLAPKPKKAIKPEPEVRGGGADAKQDEFNKLCPGAKIE